MRKFFIVPALMILAYCTSCSTSFVQKTYFASTPNLNCFQNEKEINLKLSGSFSHLDLQSNFAVNNQFGCSATAFLGNKMQYGFELAGIWYKRPRKSTYFEMQSGYGFAHIDCRKSLALEPWAIYAYGKDYGHEINAEYHKLFVQPTVFIFPDFRDPDISLGFALKLNGVFYNSYHFRYEIEHRLDDYSEDRTVCDADFNNKWGLILEPAITYRYKYFFVQLSGVFSQNIINAPVYTEHYKGIRYDLSLQSVEYAGKSRNPQHVSIVASCGFEYKFGRKKAAPQH